MHLLKHSAVWLALLSAVGISGCSEGGLSFGRKDPGPPPEPDAALAAPTAPLVRGTIGEKTYLGRSEPLLLRGFGVVIGLEDRGSADCPSALRAYLVEYLDKQFLDGPSRSRSAFSAAELIDSPDTAVVEVRGFVPAGAPKGTPFDVMVEAVAGTDTRSLAGGVLLTTELKQFQAAASGQGVIAGRALARAAGTVVTLPSGGLDPGVAPSPRTGLVLGGAMTLDERRAQLLLRSPSYPDARRIESALNQRFGQRPPTALAESAGYIELATPAGYRWQPAHFLRVAPYVLMSEDAGAREARLAGLTQAMGDGSDAEAASLAWEAAGRGALSALQPLYDHANPQVRYYAGRAGLRLGDAGAVAIVAAAAGAGDALGMAAIRELGACEFAQAGTHLSKLLDSNNAEVRIAAYEALRLHRHASLKPRVFRHVLDPQGVSLILDVVRSSGPPMIYLRFSEQPRLAVFGENMPLRLPLFYSSEDDRVILDASDRKNIKMSFRQWPLQRVSERTVPPRVIDLIAALAETPQPPDRKTAPGAGLTYGQIAQVLSALAAAGNLPASLEMDRALPPNAFAPQPSTPDRPEADESIPRSRDAEEREGDERARDAKERSRDADEPLLPLESGDSPG